MQPSSPGTGSRSALVLMIFMILAASILLGAAGLFAVSGVISYLDGNDSAGASTSLIMAGAMLLSSLLIGPSIYYNVRRTRGFVETDLPPRAGLPMPGWTLALLTLAWFGMLGLGGLLAIRISYTWWLMPLVAVPAAAMPIMLLAALALRNLPPGPPRRATSAFGLGLTLGPLAIAIMELGLFIVAIVILVMVLMLQPDLQQEFLALNERVQSAGPEEIIALLEPWLARPGVLLGVLAGVALFVPLIEEALKPVGMWLFTRQVETPVDGFVLGTLSGAAYAIFENLSAAANMQTIWPAIMLVRIGTSALHVYTSGLVGWGLASALRERRFGRLAASYGLAVLIHGMWNAGAILVGVSALGLMPGSQGGIPIHIGIALGGGLGALAFGIVALLGLNNRLLVRNLPGGESSEIPPEGLKETV
jgi:hypothetical protein